MGTLTKNRFFKGLKSDLDPLSAFLLLSVLIFFTIFLVIPVVAILSTAFFIETNGQIQFSFKFFVDVLNNPIYFELEIGSFVFLSVFALTLFLASKFMKKFQDKTFTISDLVIPLIYTIIVMYILFLFSDALTSIPQYIFGMILGLLFLGIGLIINIVKNIEFGTFFVTSSILPTLLLLVLLPSLGFIVLVLIVILSQLTSSYESIGLGDILLLSIIITLILGVLTSFVYSRRFSKNYFSSSFLKPFLWLTGACIFVIGPFLLNNYDIIVGGWQFNFYKKIADPQYGYIIVISGLEASVLINTIFVGIATTFFAAVLGVFFAFVIARYDFFGKSFIRVLLLIPLVVPPFVGAIGIKRMLAHPQGYSFFNRLFYDAIPILQYPIIIKGLTAVILVQSVHFYTLVYLNSLSAFQNIDPTLEESGENLGASGSRLFRTITLPLAIPGIAAGSILTFILSVEDLGTPLIFAGDTEIQNLLTTKIFSLWLSDIGTLQGDGLALAVILFIIAMTGFAFIRKYVGIKEYAMVSKGGTFNPRVRQISKKATGMILLFVAVLMSFALLPHIGSFLLAVSDNFTWTVTNPEHLFPTQLSYKLLSPDIGDLIRVVGIPLSWILGWILLFLFYRYLKPRINLPDSSTNPLARNSLLIITIILPILVSTIGPEIVRIFIPSLSPIATMFNTGIGKIATDTIGEIGNLTNIELLSLIMVEGGFSDVISRTTLYALIAMILIIIFGIAAAYVLARKEFPGKFAFDTLVTSPIAIPGIIVGFGLFTYYVPLLVSIFGSEISVNEIIPGFYVVHFLLIASFTVRRFPFTVRAAYAGLQQTHVTFEEASTNLGATNFQTIMKITLPLIAMNVLAGAMISFVYSLGEVSTALILLGNESQATIPWMINEKNIDPLPHAGILGVNEAAALGVLLVLLQVIIITISNRILKNRGSALTGI